MKYLVLFEGFKDINESNYQQLSDVRSNCNEILFEFSDRDIKYNLWGYEGVHNNGDIKDIMICAVDSMDTRIAIWEKIKNNRNCKLYVDGRMGAELMKIYAINPNSDEDVKFYERTLYPSSEAVELPCNARATFYNAFIIAGLIGSQVKKHLKDEKNTREIMFDLPSLFFSKSSDK